MMLKMKGGETNVPGPIRGREVAYSGRGAPETPGMGSRAAFLEGGGCQGGPSRFATGS